MSATRCAQESMGPGAEGSMKTPGSPVAHLLVKARHELKRAVVGLSDRESSALLAALAARLSLCARPARVRLTVPPTEDAALTVLEFLNEHDAASESRLCGFCGGPFKVNPRSRRSHRYCSASCRSKSRHRKNSGPLGPEPAEPEDAFPGACGAVRAGLEWRQGAQPLDSPEVPSPAGVGLSLVSSVHAPRTPCAGVDPGGAGTAALRVSSDGSGGSARGSSRTASEDPRG